MIEGAHEGHGLGHRFLSHLERTKVLVHLVDVSSLSGPRSRRATSTIITRELELFPGRDASGERLADKPVVVAANKIDALDEPERLARLEEHLQAPGVPLYAVSAATGDGHRRRCSKRCGARSPHRGERSAVAPSDRYRG